MDRRIGGLAVTLSLLWVGACGSDGTSFPDSSSATSGAGGAGGAVTDGGMGGMEPECPHSGPDLLDPETAEVCPSCPGGARCLPNGLIPADFQSQLGDCDASNKCVPDDFIRTGGNFIPPTCTSVAGGEGRCLSRCLPQVAAQADLLPQDSCPEFQLCVPCYDPITGEESGGCSLSCDPGPSQPPVTLPSCCDGLGTCVPRSLVPEGQVDLLPQDSCPLDDNDYLCAPTEAVTDPNWAPEACLTDTLIGGDQPGVCLPGCLLSGLEGLFTTQSSCAENHKCAPCDNPITGNPTGACDI